MLIADDLWHTAGCLRIIHDRIVKDIRAGQRPNGSFADIFKVLGQGLAVAEALERLANAGDTLQGQSDCLQR
ncbi:MAG TPA: hypothetical protein VH592_14120 [Gemmataceae bacterium]|jgi:hypothetical protein